MTVQGESKHLEETISTLKLAQRMMRVQNEIAAVVESDPAILLRKYEKQIRELKQELVMHDALVERTGVVYDEHTPEQKHALLQMVRHFVDAPTAEKEDEALKLTSVHEIRELFRQFKALLKAAESEALQSSARGGSHHGGSVRGGSAGSRSQSSTGSRRDIHSGDGSAGVNGQPDDVVGEEVAGATGFGLGLVSGSARPSTVDASRKSGPNKAASGNDQATNHRSPSPVRSEAELASDRDATLAGSGSRASLVGDTIDETGDGDDSDASRQKNEAFQLFKGTSAGRKLHQTLLEAKDKLFDARQRVKQVSNRVNAAKTQIDLARAKLEDKRNQRSTAAAASSKKGSPPRGRQATAADREEVVDEEEFLLMTAEREAKREYRSLFGDLKDAKAELEFTLRSVELLRMRVVREFEDWFEEAGRRVGMGSELGGGKTRTLSPSGSSGMLSTFSRDDKLDDGEQFDQMEIERVRAQDPDSVAFFQAQKKMRQQQQSSGSGGGGSSPTSPGRQARRHRRV